MLSELKVQVCNATADALQNQCVLIQNKVLAVISSSCISAITDVKFMKPNGYESPGEKIY